jgi:aspartate aminotransferase
MEKIIVNQNIQSLKPSATLAINQKVNRLRAEGKEIYHFGFGQSPFPIHESIVSTLKENAYNNHYLPTIGLEKLRDQIAQFLTKHQNIIADKNFIYIGPGSKELLYQTILILEGTFLIPKGSWVSYGPQINSKNGKFAVLDTSLKNNFKLDSSILLKYCQENPDEQKSLILNSPNNPTGAIYSSDELKKLAEVCRAYNIIVLSDEIYSQVNFHEEYSPSISNFYPERTIVFGGLSKVFSAGGYRLGFMVLPKDLEFLHDTYRSLFSETFSAVSSPIQFASIEAYKYKKELKKYVINTSQILKGISDYVYDELTLINIDCTQPSGAFYMMIGFNNFKEKINNLGITTSTELANHLLELYSVALLPSTDFYFEKHDLFFRLAFVDFDGETVYDLFKNKSMIDKFFIRDNCPNIFKGIEKINSFINDIS